MAKTSALVFGIILVLLGLLGFVSNPLSSANGLFVVNAAHNIVYLLLGIILLIASRSGQASSAMWLKIVGAVAVILAILGFLLAPNGPMLLGIFAVNMADHWLHLVVGVVVFFLGMRGNSASSQPMGMA